MSQLSSFFNTPSVKTIIADASANISVYPDGNSQEDINSGGIAAGYPEDIGRVLSVKSDSTTLTQYFFGEEKIYDRSWVFHDPANAFALPDTITNGEKWFGYNMWSYACTPVANNYYPLTDGTAFIGPGGFPGSTIARGIWMYTTPPSGHSSNFIPGESWTVSMKFEDYDRIFTNVYVAGKIGFGLEDYDGNYHSYVEFNKLSPDTMRIYDGTTNITVDGTNFDGTSAWGRITYDGTGTLDIDWSADGTTWTNVATSTGRFNKTFDINETHLYLFSQNDGDEPQPRLTGLDFQGNCYLLGSWSPWKSDGMIPGEARHINDGTDVGYGSLVWMNLEDHSAPNGYFLEYSTIFDSTTLGSHYPYFNNNFGGGNPKTYNGANYAEDSYNIYHTQSNDTTSATVMIHRSEQDTDYLYWLAQGDHYPEADAAGGGPINHKLQGRVYIDEAADEFVFEYTSRYTLTNNKFITIEGTYRDKAFGETVIRNITVQSYETTKPNTPNSLQGSLRII